MGFIKWLLWTGFAVGFGIFLATYRVEGKTPYDHMQALWGAHAPRQAHLDSIKDALDDAREQVKDQVEAQIDKPVRPKERHSAEDRAQVNKLIAKKATGT